MKRYTIQKNGQIINVMECEDLNAFYPKGLPEDFKGAEITEVNIDSEIAQRKADIAAKENRKSAAKALKGKVGKFNDDEIKLILDALLENL